MINLQQKSLADIEALQDFRSPAFTVTAASVAVPADNTPFILGTTVSDPDGIYNTTTGIVTAPIDGYYKFSANIQFSHSAASNQFFNIGLYKNGAIAQLQTIRAISGVTDKDINLLPITIPLLATETAFVGKLSTNFAGLVASGNPSFITGTFVRKL